MKVGWRLIQWLAESADLLDSGDGEAEDPWVVLAELRAWEADMGKRASEPLHTWIDRRAIRFIPGFCTSPPPARSNLAGTTSPQAQGGI